MWWRQYGVADVWHIPLCCDVMGGLVIRLWTQERVLEVVVEIVEA